MGGACLKPKKPSLPFHLFWQRTPLLRSSISLALSLFLTLLVEAKWCFLRTKQSTFRRCRIHFATLSSSSHSATTALPMAPLSGSVPRSYLRFSPTCYHQSQTNSRDRRNQKNSCARGADFNQPSLRYFPLNYKPFGLFFALLAGSQRMALRKGSIPNEYQMVQLVDQG